MRCCDLILYRYMPDDHDKITNKGKWGREYGGHRALWGQEWRQRDETEGEKRTMGHEEYQR